jgi:hypothetical protein
MNEDVAQELNRLANLQGKTLYSLINEGKLDARAIGGRTVIPAA